MKNKMKYPAFFNIYILIFLLGSLSSFVQAQTLIPPYNPANVVITENNIELKYNNQVILRATIEGFDDQILYNQTIDTIGPLQQVIKFSSRNNSLTFSGKITGSKQSFPCEADPPEDAIPMVRHSVGLSHSLRNHAVYDRQSDWVISIDHPTNTIIAPDESTDLYNSFTIFTSGYEIIIRFRPYFYNQHKGLKYFKPWNYKVWDKSVAGWCSWFAYFRDINEDNIKKAADIISQKLLPYGIDYLQIDDGYQEMPAGMPDTWLDVNDKFPSGLDNLCNYIELKGLKPGIWTYTSFHQKDEAFAHKEWFVRNGNDEPAYGNWVGYIMDGNNKGTIDSIILPLYQGLKEMGWKYYKVDALRHLKYEGYNSYSDYFTEKGLNPVEIYRQLAMTIRNAVGRENFMLGCWGIRPELIGIIDGCRIGTDGFGYGGLAQYNSYNNIVWRNDPDHIELSPEEAWRSSMVTSLTGSIFMLTDKPEIYQTEIADPAKRCVPVPFT